MATTTSLNYLIPRLRLHMGDINASAYRYLDEWLSVALLSSVETLQRWWNYKYLLDAEDEAYRNPRTTFLHSSPPVIEDSDNRIVILMSAIILKAGDLQNVSWNVGAWRDAEISYSSIEGSRTKRYSLQADWDELTSLISPPSKKLSYSIKGHLPGFLDNYIERTPDEQKFK